MVRLDTDTLQMPADADGISGGIKNVCVRTSLVCRGGHQSWWPPPWAYFVITSCDWTKDTFRYSALSLGSHYDHYNEVAVYFLWAMHYVFKLSVCLHTYLRACLMLESLTVLPSTSSFIFTLTHQDEWSDCRGAGCCVRGCMIWRCGST